MGFNKDKQITLVLKHTIEAQQGKSEATIYSMSHKT